jgi:Fe-S cluster assembly protein SufB
MTTDVEEFIDRPYDSGFKTDIEYDSIPPGLNEDIIRAISDKKDEPDWLLEFRLKAYRHWEDLHEPSWQNVDHETPNFEEISYYSAPKDSEDDPESLDEVDPKILETYEKLGIPLEEQKMLQNVAVDAVFDSVSVAAASLKKLKEAGVIFCSISEAAHDHPELVREHLGTVVPYTDNFYASLNSAVFSDGSFVYVPEGVDCPMELSTYFRINAEHTGQFERTLIICEDDAYVSYLEGCTAPQYSENQLHAAVVELIAKENSEIKYSTVQNWYPGDEDGQGGVYNFVTKRGECRGDDSKISWTQVETGSAVTWKYPSCVLKGDNSVGEFYSVALTNNHQQADTGTKMIHLGEDTRSKIISKGISAGESQNSYRGQVKVTPRANNSRNYSVCDSMLIGQECGAHTFPYIDVQNDDAQVEHEASTSRIGEEQLFYLQQRGLDEEDAISMIIRGFCEEVFRELPMEFAVEAKKLLGIQLEGAVG